MNIAAVNDAPVGTNNAISMLEGGTQLLAAADFPFTDAEPDALLEVIVTGVSGGTLFIDSGNDGIDPGDAVTTFPTPVTPAMFAANQVYFRPNTNLAGTGAASISFQIRDDGGTANSGADTDRQSPTRCRSTSPASTTRRSAPTRR